MATAAVNSIQNKIDDHLEDPDLPRSSIVIREASGSGVVPSGCHIRFFDCNIEHLDVEGKSTVVLQDCTIDTFDISDSEISVRRCDIRQPTFRNCRGLVEDCLIREELFCYGEFDRDGETIEGRSRLDLKRCEFKKRIATIEDSWIEFYEPIVDRIKRGLKAERSKIVISRANVVTDQRVIYLEDHCVFRMIDSAIEGINNEALHATGHCYIIATSTGEFTPDNPRGVGFFGWSAHCVLVENHSQFYGHNVHLRASRRGLDYGIHASKDSYAELNSSTGQHEIKGGALPSVAAEERSTIYINGYKLIECEGEIAVVAKEDSKVVIHDIKETVRSEATDCVLIEDNSEVEIKLCPEVIGVDNAINMKRSCKILLDRIDLVEGEAISAILAEDGCIAEVTSCELLTSPEPTLDFKRSITLIARSIQEIICTGAEAMLVDEDCKLNCYDIGVIESTTTDAIRMTNDCFGMFYRCERIQGVDNGFWLTSRCWIHCRNCTEILGDDINGLFIEVNSTGRATHGTTISGGEDGVKVLDKSECTVEHYQEVKGAVNGVEADLGDAVNLRHIELIKGAGISGIKCAEDISLDVYKVKEIIGSDNGILLETRCICMLESSELIEGGVFGFKTSDECETQAYNIDELSGGTEALLVESESQFFARWIENLHQNVQCLGSELHWERVTFTDGRFLAENSKINWEIVNIADYVEHHNVVFRWREVDISEHYLGEDSQGDGSLVTIGDFLDDTDSSNKYKDIIVQSDWIELRCSSKVSHGLIHGNVDIEAGEWFCDNTEVLGDLLPTDQTTRTSSSVIQGTAKAITSTLDGDTTEYVSGVDLTQSSADVRACDLAGAIVNDASSYRQQAGECGDITADSSGLVVRGGTAGSITATSCGVELVEANTGSIDLSSSGLYSLGSSTGNISLGSSAVHIISTDSGSITGARETVDSARGDTVRYMTGNLEENVGGSVRIWHDNEREERVAKHWTMNVESEYRYLRVNGDEQVDIKGNSSIQILDDREVEVSGNFVREVDGTEDIDIGSNRIVQIGGNSSIDVAGNKDESIDGTYDRYVREAETLVTQSSLKRDVKTAMDLTVEGILTEIIGADRSIQITGNDTITVGSLHQVEALIANRTVGTAITDTANQHSTLAANITHTTGSGVNPDPKPADAEGHVGANAPTAPQPPDDPVNPSPV